MSFGNAAVFPYPAVQYIPLPLTTLRQKQFEASNPQTKVPQLIIGPEIQNWLKVIVSTPADYDLPVMPPGQLTILALNLEINDAKYRGHLVTLLGKTTPGLYQLAVLPRQYFYKKTLFFELYDQGTFERLLRNIRHEL